MLDQSRDSLAEAFSSIAREAGAVIMEVYASAAMARLKADRSPVTAADELAETVILRRLEGILPGVPVIAEESVSKGIVPEAGRRFLLVDPLDGTKEFLSRNGEFTVYIALVEDGRPTVGCIFAPAIDALYAAGTTSWREVGSVRAPLATRPYPADGLVALCSRSHPDPQSDAFLAVLPVAGRSEAGSSLKFCRVAEGAADIYPRFGPTMEWDVAAGHAVLAAAGGTVVSPSGSAFLYGKRGAGYRNEAFVAWGGEPIPAR
jgi:3'(2'), 5'-bisphosphate nucleotidase